MKVKTFSFVKKDQITRVVFKKKQKNLLKQNKFITHM